MILLSACVRILNVVKTAYLPVGAAATAAGPVPVPGDPCGSHRAPLAGRKERLRPGGRLGHGRAKPRQRAGHTEANSATARPRQAPLRQTVPLRQTRGGLTPGPGGRREAPSRGSGRPHPGPRSPSRGGKPPHRSGASFPGPGGLIRGGCSTPGGKGLIPDPEASSRAQKPHPGTGSSTPGGKGLIPNPEALSRTHKPHPRAGSSTPGGKLHPEPRSLIPNPQASSQGGKLIPRPG